MSTDEETDEGAKAGTEKRKWLKVEARLRERQLRAQAASESEGEGLDGPDVAMV